MDNRDNIEDLFRSKLDGFMVPLPEDSWGRIEESLYDVAQKRAAFVVRAKWILSSAAVIAALIVGGILFMNVPTENDSIIISEVTTQSPSPSPSPSPELSGSTTISDSSSEEIIKKSTIGTENISENVTNISSQKSKLIASVAKRTNDKQNDIAPVQLELSEETVEAGSLDNVDVINLAYQSDIDEAEMERLIEEFAQQGAVVNSFLDMGESDEDNGFTLALNARGGLNSSQQMVNTPLSLRSSGDKSLMASNSKMLMASNLKSTESLTTIDLTDNISEMEHQQPISFGIVVSKSISDRISLETGLLYTFLSSKAKNTAIVFKSNETQRLHYLGIPVNMNYKLFSINKLDMFVTLGGVFEKDIYGKYEYVDKTILEGMNSESENKVSVNIRQKRPQLSVNTGVGINYPIYNNFSIYGKMGGAYYFDANNKYKTIYSDKKIVLDMNVGIKFDF